MENLFLIITSLRTDDVIVTSLDSNDVTITASLRSDVIIRLETTLSRTAPGKDTTIFSLITQKN